MLLSLDLSPSRCCDRGDREDEYTMCSLDESSLLIMHGGAFSSDFAGVHPPTTSPQYRNLSKEASGDPVLLLFFPSSLKIFPLKRGAAKG